MDDTITSVQRDKVLELLEHLNSISDDSLKFTEKAEKDD